MLRFEPPTLVYFRSLPDRETTGSPEVWHDCESTFTDPAPANDLPVCHSIFAAPHALDDWQARLDAERFRPVDAALAARVLQRIQNRTGTGDLPGPCHATRNQRLENVSTEDLAEFFRAAGLSAEQLQQLESRHRMSAAAASLATLPAAFLGTGLSSLINAMFPENNPARLAGFLLNLVLLLLTPWLNALVMQPINVLMDQQKRRHYVLRVKNTVACDVHSKSVIIIELYKALCSADNTFENLEIIMEHARAKQVADRRVYLDGRWQQLARYPKTVMAPVGQLLRAARWISAWASAGFQMGASIGTAALQAVLAGVDARSQQQFTARCHLLAAPPLTERGRARLLQGRTLCARHIDETALRAFVIGPAESRLVLLQRCLRARFDGAGAVGDRAHLQADLERLAQWRLPELEPDGTAARWLLAEGHQDPLQWADLAARMQKRGQISSQFCKFLGQQWQVGIGPGYFVLVPKLLNVASGGHPALPGMVACAGLSAVLGIAACAAFPAVVVECNEMQVRIDMAGVAPGFLGTLLDAGVALVALPRQLYQQRRFDHALAAAGQALTQRTVARPAAC